MRLHPFPIALGCILLMGLASAAATQEQSRTKPTPQQRIARALHRLTGAPAQNLPAPVPIVTPALNRAFPHELFYSLTFPQWPLGEVPPRPLSSSNVIAYSKGGEVIVLSQPGMLKSFFNASHRPGRDARTDLLAWLDLTWIFSEDGYFRFSVEQDVNLVQQNGDWLATGKDIVQPNGGDAGEIDVSLLIAPTGVILSADETRNVRTGIRPICQATKLLDPDPIVRGMAEQSLLVLGSRARPYLDQQRAKASPALQKAIDAMWQRIQERERSLQASPATTKPTQG